MIRIHIICEGQTEETFVKNILSPYFNSNNIFLYPRLIGRIGHKGGNVNFQRLFKDINVTLKSDITAYWVVVK